MAKREGAIDVPPSQAGPTNSKLIASDEQFRRILNFFPTEEGGLVSVRKPIPMIPKVLVGGPPANGTPDPGPIPIVYGTTYGIHHARVKGGERDILLLHTNTQVWAFKGWSRAWQVLIGPSSSSPYVVADLPTPVGSDFPTQFVSTPTGVVIIPQGGRAYFYDGITCLPLGYDHAPAPPLGKGPENTANQWFPDPTQPILGVNDTGYTVDALYVSPTEFHPPSAMYPWFRFGRIGTIDAPGNVSVLAEDGNEGLQAQVMGYLLPGRWRAKTQWVDRWGNLSPLSGESNDIRFTRQPAMCPRVSGAGYALKWVQATAVQKQIAWEGISPGPEGTIARKLFRTLDLENSGDVNFYALPRDSTVNTGAFATLPDNFSRVYPDNIPDAWLNDLPTDVIPIPSFRLAEMAFGRLCMANVPGDEGALYVSMIGRWGTIENVAGSKLYPDPRGQAITGLHRVDDGLLAFTETSTYLVTPNDDGRGFRSATKHPMAGTVAPSSIATMRNGLTIWLGVDGFYGYANGEVSFLFELHRSIVKKINRARRHRAVACFDHHSGEYRCWVAYDGSTRNTMCFTYNGTDWHQRDDVAASGVTVTDDHRRLVIACGEVDDVDGVWIVDRGGDPVVSTVETGWMRSLRSQENASVRTVYLWLRETTVTTVDNTTNRIQVAWSQDYRAETVGTATARPWPGAKPGYGTVPDIYDDAVYGAATWRKRRPFWAKVDINVQSCEVFRLTITCPRRWELLAVSFEEQPRTASGALKTR